MGINHKKGKKIYLSWPYFMLENVKDENFTPNTGYIPLVTTSFATLWLHPYGKIQKQCCIQQQHGERSESYSMLAILIQAKFQT